MFFAKRYPALFSLLSLLALPLSACQIEGSLDGGSKMSEGAGEGEADEGHDPMPKKNKKKKAGAGNNNGDKKKKSGGAELPGAETGGQGPGSTGGGTDSSGNDNSNSTGTDSTDTSTEPAPECNSQDPVKLFLSPDDSNSLSSPSQLKQRLLGAHAQGELYGVPIRGWEFFNYYSFPYPEPEGTLGATLELRAVGDAPGHYRLQIGVRSKTWTYQARPAMNLTFVLDTSGSMQGPAIDMLKASVRAIAGGLRAGDKVSVVTWSASQTVMLDSHTVTAAGDPALLKITDALEPGGGTDLHGGLTRGYELAQKNYINNAINRVILVSDGGANLGVVSKELIGKQAQDSGKDGIYLAGVGVGTESSYRDALMDEVTDAGKGASVFIHSDAEAKRIFGDQFLSTLGVAAKNVQVQLDMPPGFEVLEFSGEEMDTDPSKVDPQHLGPNDSMVFYQEIKNCAPDKLDPNATIKVTVRYQDALTHQPGQVIAEASIANLLQAPAPALGKGTALTFFVDAMKAAQKEVQKGSSSDASSDAAQLRAKAKAKLEQEIASAPDDAELKELLAQINRVGQP